MLILLRHATPLIDYGRCNYQTFTRRHDAYDTTSDVDTNEINGFRQSRLYRCLKKPLAERDFRCYCSPLARAKATYQQIFPEMRHRVSIEDDLEEATLNTFAIPLLRLKVRTWFFLFRLFCLLHRHETARLRQRSASVYQRLIADHNALLMTHGVLIFFLKKQLRQAGYIQLNTYRNGCLTVEVWDNQRSS